MHMVGLMSTRSIAYALCTLCKSQELYASAGLKGLIHGWLYKMDQIDYQPGALTMGMIRGRLAGSECSPSVDWSARKVVYPDSDSLALRVRTLEPFACGAVSAVMKL